jgi:hypothetical protein
VAQCAPSPRIPALAARLRRSVALASRDVFAERLNPEFRAEFAKEHDNALAQAGQERGHGHHRSDADDDAENGEQGAEAVRAHRLDRHLHILCRADIHELLRTQGHHRSSFAAHSDSRDDFTMLDTASERTTYATVMCMEISRCDRASAPRPGCHPYPPPTLRARRLQSDLHHDVALARADGLRMISRTLGDTDEHDVHDRCRPPPAKCR